jgi:hypothetical protein
MRIITQNKRRRKVYAWQEEDEFLLSPFKAVQHGRRPIARFDSAQELERVASDKGCIVQWQ